MSTLGTWESTNEPQSTQPLRRHDSRTSALKVPIEVVKVAIDMVMNNDEKQLNNTIGYFFRTLREVACIMTTFLLLSGHAGIT